LGVVGGDPFLKQRYILTLGCEGRVTLLLQAGVTLNWVAPGEGGSACIKASKARARTPTPSSDGTTKVAKVWQWKKHKTTVNISKTSRKGDKRVRA